ncbi:hypothetical protein [Nocardia tengchongensis]
MTFALPQPELLWARIVAEGHALLNHQGDGSQSVVTSPSGSLEWAVGDRLVSEDGAGNWFVLVHAGNGRALLFGGDESSELFESDFNPWEDAPEWVLKVDRTVAHPRLSAADVVTFARWWGGSEWGRTPYDSHLPEDAADDPDADDGLYMGLRSVVDQA